MLEEFFKEILLKFVTVIGAFIRYLFLKMIGRKIDYKSIRYNEDETGFLNFILGLGFFIAVIIGVIFLVNKSI